MHNFSASSGLFSRTFSLNLNGRLLDLSRPVIMGIVNATPDSFYPGSRVSGPDEAVRRAAALLEEGAEILDVGALSTRPGSREVPVEEELNRLGSVLEAIRGAFPGCALSVDTYRSAVVRTMKERFDIAMVNDVSAGRFDDSMLSTVAELRLAYVIMHMQGTPETMQKEPLYDNVVDDLLQFFSERVYRCRKLGVNDLVVDPGFGFGKTMEQNYQLLRELDAFAMLELPLMAGMSRKAMVYRTLGIDAEQALNGTTAVNMAALLGGARILRVHDVKEARETVEIFRQIVKRPDRPA